MKQSDILKHDTTALQAAPVQARTLADCARLCKQLGQEVAELNIKHLQRFWLSIMADKAASHKDRLQASRLYADSIGAFDQHKAAKGINGAFLHWKQRPIDVEVVPDKKSN